MYTDEIDMTSDLVMFIWHIAKKYKLNTLSQKCIDFLESQLSAENAAILLDQSFFFDDADMIRKCLRKIRRDPHVALKVDSFSGIRQSTLNCILDMDQTRIPEVEIFQACKKWAQQRCTAEKDRNQCFKYASYFGQISRENPISINAS